jgi:hypothetical protein
VTVPSSSSGASPSKSLIIHCPPIPVGRYFSLVVETASLNNPRICQSLAESDYVTCKGGGGGQARQNSAGTLTLLGLIL